MSQNSHECYTNVFLTAHPKDGLHSVQEKQRQGNMLDEELAQYFKERALIEDQYAKSLVKASKRLYVMDSATLGGMAPVWELLLNELTEISTAHGILAYKITEEIEKALKIPACSDVDKIKSLEPTYQQLAKDYEVGIKNKKSGKSSLFKSAPKVQSDKVMSTWSTEGPSFLQLYENVERARLQRLKSLVENFEQFSNDQILKRTEIANKTLSANSAFDVDNDIRQFCKLKSSHLTALSATPSTVSVAYTPENDSSSSPHSVNVEAPRQLNEKKQRSRFSILRKSRKPSSPSLGSELHRISSIPEYTEQHDQLPKENISESFTNLQHDSPGNHQQHDESPYKSQTTQSPTPSRNLSTSAVNSDIAKNQAPPVDSEGYSIPFPDTFGQTPTGDGAVILDDTRDLDSSSPFGSQKLKFDIKDRTTQEDRQQSEQENATLTRVSSLLRESTPTTSQKRRGRRTNMRVQSSYWEAGPPSPLSSVNEHGSITMGSTISSSSDQAMNPFRQTTPTSEHANISTLSPSPTSSSQHIPRSRSSSAHDQKPTLHATIVETVNVPTPGTRNANIVGQIKMGYDGPTLPNDTFFTVRLDHVQNIQPINSFVQQHNNSNEFIVSIRAFLDHPGGSLVPLFSYHQQDMAIDKVLPMVADAAWKISETSAMLMVKYKLTDQMPTAADQGRLMVLASPGQATVTKAQSTPEGTWNQQQQCFIWKAEGILQQQQAAAATHQQTSPRLLAKFMIDSSNMKDPSSTTTSPSLTLKYYCRDTLASGMTLTSWILPRADDKDNGEGGLVDLQFQIDQRMTRSGTVFLG
ncbi:hypothetical protein BCR42DRAFT_418475 [Absidia repens]|uniref:MHD domain-containing protein n=1 Tax=Absidia repens TaxID=90262 RepID=A0A1X2IBN6_9FUNG|nr:hypothetical protein BCR42DRAFT_418475 [Absidia repens]